MMITNKVSIADFLAFEMDYTRRNNLYYYHMRFGQSFLNKFYSGSGDETDNQLYYTEDKKLARQIIWKYYIDVD
jgi:hypothetical protein